MRILYITDAFAVWGGMERVLADKMNYLAAHYGYDVVLLTVNQGTHDIPFKLNTAIKHIDLGVGMHQQYAYHGIARLWKRQELKRLLGQRMRTAVQQIRPNLIVCVKLDFVGVLMKVKGSAPLLVESHTLCKSESLDGSGWLRRLHVYSFKRNIRRADAVIALTEGDAADWRCINRNVYVIPNVVHLNDSGRYSNLDGKSAIFVGRFSYQKDIESLLRIWEIVHHRHPDWSLNIYGEGELCHLLDDAQGLPSMNVVVHQPTAQICEAYLQNSMLFLTSLFEPFGLVLPEAMSCGLPVVAFDCPYGPADIITDGVDGFLIRNRSISDFADKVCLLMEDAALRQRRGQVGIQSAQRFSADNIMPQWKALFEKVTTGDNKEEANKALIFTAINKKEQAGLQWEK